MVSNLDLWQFLYFLNEITKLIFNFYFFFFLFSGKRKYRFGTKHNYNQDQKQSGEIALIFLDS